jgi:predicted RNA-binding protein with PIN domain
VISHWQGVIGTQNTHFEGCSKRSRGKAARHSPSETYWRYVAASGEAGGAPSEGWVPADGPFSAAVATMWIIVDGYNLIRQWPELAMLDRADLQSGREALLQELRGYQQAKRHRITVVFDGRERGGISGGAEKSCGIEVRYSRQGETADAVIAQLVAKAGEGAVVVSSDHQVQVAARRHGATPLPSEEFMDRVEVSRVAALKGGDEDDCPQKSGKGTARRLPKRERREERRLKGL